MVLWGNFGGTLRVTWGHLGGTHDSPRGYFWVTWGGLWSTLGTLRVLWGHFGDTLGVLCGHFWVTFQTIWRNWGHLLAKTAVILRSEPLDTWSCSKLNSMVGNRLTTE